EDRGRRRAWCRPRPAAPSRSWGRPPPRQPPTGSSSNAAPGSIAREALAAPAGCLRVGVLQLEAGGHEGLLVPELRTHQVQVALRIDEDADAVLLEDLVPLLWRLGPLDHVGQPGAAAAAHRHPQSRARRVAL